MCKQLPSLESEGNPFFLISQNIYIMITLIRYIVDNMLVTILSDNVGLLLRLNFKTYIPYG
jgi:hypothetical protein